MLKLARRAAFWFGCGHPGHTATLGRTARWRQLSTQAQASASSQSSARGYFAVFALAGALGWKSQDTWNKRASGVDDVSRTFGQFGSREEFKAAIGHLRLALPEDGKVSTDKDVLIDHGFSPNVTLTSSSSEPVH